LADGIREPDTGLLQDLKQHHHEASLHHRRKGVPSRDAAVVSNSGVGISS
jgi:hypothetical protein